MMIIAGIVVRFYGTKAKTKTEITATRILVCFSRFYEKYTLENLLRYVSYSLAAVQQTYVLTV